MIKFAAFFNFAFGVFHLFFWRLLHWKEQLNRVSLVNRAVVQTLNLCLAFMFFLVAYLGFFNTAEIQSTKIGQTLYVGMAFFWFLRTIAQVYFYPLKERVHQILLILFIIGIFVHILPFL
ncbi:hypothetical protein KDJ56_07365 [Brevibacillus composti]|uniref:Uncharacterized protein n=1 Tax=Brevibacillus composti TaxID=2796470 RepID=A0A7T5ENE6_9BACL|nr:hypothetical protein [Brevibacillus composti]QQE75747.1 hypothetical protein JD108_07685 [Brevibacillus composti]QUO42773.1 hypothetical protein KDJ56_07365 [Brevibacillus composti]